MIVRKACTVSIIILTDFNELLSVTIFTLLMLESRLSIIMEAVATISGCVVGLRGAIAFALSLHIDIEKEKREVLVTATLIIVLFTLLFLGGGTMPLMSVSVFIQLF